MLIKKSEGTSGVQKKYICKSATCNCENGKYLASIVDDSVITCDAVTEKTKTIPTATGPASTVPTKSVLLNIYILVALLLIH